MTIIIKVITGLETDLLVEIEGHHIEVEVGLDKIMARILAKIIEGDCKTITVMIFIRENYRGQNYRNRSRNRNNYKDNYRDDYRWDNNFGRDRSRMRERPSLRNAKGVTEVVVDQGQDQHQGLDQVQELVQKEIELGVISVGNMPILLVNAPTLSQMKHQTDMILTVN